MPVWIVFVFQSRKTIMIATFLVSGVGFMYVGRSLLIPDSASRITLHLSQGFAGFGELGGGNSVSDVRRKSRSLRILGRTNGGGWKRMGFQVFLAYLN